MDLERLDEALKFYGHPDSYTGIEEVVLSAAAAYRDLLANGPVKATKCVFPLVEECLLVYPTTDRVSYDGKAV